MPFRLRDAHERLIDLVVDLIVHGAGDADPAGLGQRLDARGNVHAVAEDIAVRSKSRQSSPPGASFRRPSPATAESTGS